MNTTTGIFWCVFKEFKAHFGQKPVEGSFEFQQKNSTNTAIFIHKFFIFRQRNSDFLLFLHYLKAKYSFLKTTQGFGQNNSRIWQKTHPFGGQEPPLDSIKLTPKKDSIPPLKNLYYYLNNGTMLSIWLHFGQQIHFCSLFPFNYTYCTY